MSNLCQINTQELLTEFQSVQYPHTNKSCFEVDELRPEGEGILNISAFILLQCQFITAISCTHLRCGFIAWGLTRSPPCPTPGPSVISISLLSLGPSSGVKGCSWFCSRSVRSGCEWCLTRWQDCSVLNSHDIVMRSGSSFMKAWDLRQMMDKNWRHCSSNPASEREIAVLLPFIVEIRQKCDGTMQCNSWCKDVHYVITAL